MTTIKIKKKNLIFRDQAHDLKKQCREKLNSSRLVYLDFSNVDFAFRSFLDELLNIINKEKKIKIINLKSPLLKFLNKVQKTKQQIKSYL